MPAPPMASTELPSSCGAPGYSVPLPLVMEPPMFYGDPGVPVPQNTIDMSHVVRGVLRHDPQEYDPYPLAYNPAQGQPTLNGLYGLGLTKMVTPPFKPEQITLPKPQPVKQSTTFAVLAGSALIVGASVALFVLLRKKG